MSVQRYLTTGGLVRYRARISSGGREIARKTFERRADAVSWEQDQSQRLRHGEWSDPRRGRATVQEVADDWLASRSAVKRRTLETDAAIWRNYIAPTWARRQVSSVTTAEIARWTASIIDRGRSRSTATRALATMRSLMNHAIDDGRITRNPAEFVKRPAGGRARREGQTLTAAELHDLADACRGPYSDLVLVLGLEGLRWGELAGLQVGDVVSKPGAGLRLQRAVLTSGGGGKLFVDTLKSHRARTVPIVDEILPIVRTWCSGKNRHDWIFAAPEGGMLRESNWQRSVRWQQALVNLGRPGFRVHDLRHTAASMWLGHGADPKVVQRVLGHASAAMTMDLYGHLIDQNLWDAARQVSTSAGISPALNTPDTLSTDEHNAGKDALIRGDG